MGSVEPHSSKITLVTSHGTSMKLNEESVNLDGGGAHHFERLGPGLWEVRLEVSLTAPGE